jgi:hypothetical protein
MTFLRAAKRLITEGKGRRGKADMALMGAAVAAIKTADTRRSPDKPRHDDVVSQTTHPKPCGPGRHNHLLGGHNF